MNTLCQMFLVTAPVQPWSAYGPSNSGCLASPSDLLEITAEVVSQEHHGACLSGCWYGLLCFILRLNLFAFLLIYEQGIL